MESTSPEEQTRQNAAALTAELQWLSALLQTRLQLHFGQPGEHADIRDIAAPALANDCAYAYVVQEFGFGQTERILLALALAPHVQPELLDVLFVRNANTDRGYTEFGGLKGSLFGGFLPTGQTALFLLAGNDLEARLRVQTLFSESPLFQRRILELSPAPVEEPRWSGVLSLAPESLDMFLRGSRSKPDFGPDFPATRITTALDWQDLVLDRYAFDQVQHLVAAIRLGPTWMRETGLDKRLKPGTRALFHGMPGTGKTLVATLIGKATARDVYRIDCSTIVSKYKGETEHSLARIFDRATLENWILFLDEAEALPSDSSLGSFLWRRVEEYPGIVIAATKSKAILGPAFTDRIASFESVIYFPRPDLVQRLALWKAAFDPSHSAAWTLDPDIDFKVIAEGYEISGGAINNILRHVVVEAFRGDKRRVTRAGLLAAIRLELEKEGRPLSLPMT